MTLDRSRSAVHARQDAALRLREQGMNYTQIAAQLGYTMNGRVYGSAARNAVLSALARQTKQGGSKGRRFGVEIETVGASREALANAISAVVGYHVPVLGYHGNQCSCGCGRSYDSLQKLQIWKVERDGSLRHSASGHRNTGEVVSPILQGKEGFEQLEAVIRAIHAAGARTNRSTGLHVHVEANDLTGEEVARVVEFYASNQRTIDDMVSVSRRNNRFCQKYSPYRVNGMKQAAQANKDSIRGYANKYTVVNIAPLFSYGTIEFRQHQGSVNAKKISSWVKFVQGIVDAAQIATDLDTSVELTNMLDVMVDKKVLEMPVATYLKGRQQTLSTN